MNIAKEVLGSLRAEIEETANARDNLLGDIVGILMQQSQ